MSYETIRINELAKELNLSNKDLLEKLAKISITGKTHSSTLTPDQVKKIKDFIANGEKIAKPQKPKAFIVKKTKEVEKVEPKEEKPAVEVKKPEIEKPRIEIVKPKNRLEIVKRVPRQMPAPNIVRQKPDSQNSGEKRTFNRNDDKDRKYSQNRNERAEGDKSERGKKPERFEGAKKNYD